MKYVDEFRDARLARRLATAIGELLAEIPAARDRSLQIMEFCGGHTHAIFRYGLGQLLPPAIEFVHGPGCPVCILPRARVDAAVALAQRPEVILATFGDAMRVPGSHTSLFQARAQGADVRMVYSPLDALALARRHPRRQVVFFAVGFETTMPGTALTVLQAAREDISNFSLLCCHVTTPPALRAVLEAEDVRLDGFIAPGHVAMVVGEAAFRFVAEEYGRPIVISGFEPVDILQALWMVLRQLVEGRSAVENQYGRVVARTGNPAAREAVTRVFELGGPGGLRGLGGLTGGGVRIREAYARFDAERRFSLPGAEEVPDPEACRCGEVLRGALRPPACPLFGTACTPTTPLGALMVSSEGACAAYHRFATGRPATVVHGEAP